MTENTVQPEGEKTYHLTDDELDSVLFRMYHDPDGTPTRVQLAIGDKLRAQFEQQGGRSEQTPRR